jgi:class 3 adenylate cyclase
MTEGPLEDAQSPPAAIPNFGSTVTILFSDIRGFSEFTDEYGDAVAYRMVQVHNSILKERFDLYRGHIVKTQGDSFMVSFDAARTAVTCAIAIQRELGKLHREHGTKMQVGIGINVGEPIREGTDFFGGTVNLASRICGVADPGQILVSDAVRAVAGKIEGTTFAYAGDYELKGFRDRQRLYKVDWSDVAGPMSAPAVVEPAPSPEKKGHAIDTPLNTISVTGRTRAPQRRPMMAIITFVVIAVLALSAIAYGAANHMGKSTSGNGSVRRSETPAAVVASPSSGSVTGTSTAMGITPTFSFTSATSTYTGGSGYVATLTGAVANGFTLAVTFDARGNTDMIRPEGSCIQLTDPTSGGPMTELPLKRQLGTDAPGRFAGTYLFPMIVPGKYNFVYGCNSSYSDATIGSASLPLVAVSRFSGQYFAAVFKVEHQSSSVVLYIGSAGQPDLAAPGDSCLQQTKGKLALTDSQLGDAEVEYVGELTYTAVSSGDFVYACNAGYPAVRIT